MIRTAIHSQVWLSKNFDRLLPAEYRVDGNSDFLTTFAPKYLRHDLNIYDVGSGRHPLLSADRKYSLRARVIGLDIDEGELRAAPSGTYDEAICADITTYNGRGDGDLVVCQALLEHVNGVDRAFRAMATLLKPGGTAIIFVPSRNALFARLNLVLPHDLKRKLLFSVFPHTRAGQGFKSYYDHCTPGDFRRMADENGFDVVEISTYYTSSYFSFLFPLYFVWRLWVLVFRALAKEQAAETFCMALRKR